MLYIVGTPIGNLQDFSARGIEVLKLCDYILCEDTRTSQVLLKQFNINKPLKSYHKFNEQKELASIVSDLQAGKNIALISDAGMPCVSDPGNVLINALKKENLKCTVVPGASALLNAFVLSGFGAPFTFVGFLPEKEKAIVNLLTEVKNYNSCLIFYVSCHDVSFVFEKLLSVLGDREVCIARELTKMYETVSFTTLKQGYVGVLKGEFVLVINKPNEINELNELSIADHIKHYLHLGLTKNEAIKTVSKERKIKKDEVYKVAININ